MHPTTRPIAVAFSLLLAGSGVAWGQQVTLTSPSGGINLSGTLQSYEDGVYVVETAVGTISIESTAVICSGACPDTVPEMGIATNIAAGERLVAELLAAYATGIGARAERIDDADGATRTAIRDNGSTQTLLEIDTVGPETGAAPLLGGTAELGLLTPPPLGPEPSLDEAEGLAGLTALGLSTPIALDGVAIVVHPDNPIQTLAQDEVAALLSGGIDRWSSLGGDDVPVTVYSIPRDNPVTRAAIATYVEPSGGVLTDAARIQPDSAALATAISGDRGAIGILRLGAASPARPVSITGGCGLATRATPFDAKTGEYALRAPVTLYRAAPDIPERALALAAFASSEDAARAVRAAGFVDLGVERQDQTDAARRVRALIDISADETEVHLLRELYIDMLEWDRITTTIRFDDEDPLQLSGDGEQQYEELIDHLSDLPGGAEIMLVGFTNSGGTLEDRLALSRDRSLLIEDRLYDSGAVPPAALVLSKGFADLKPVGCFAEEDGRRLNSRVEVWIKR